ncbi:MFS transporter [Entomomonas moraniae]|uniref:MFS transporter n=2 Tax=Entomomonas moraniae TaxID=2213226 RepID=A0A3Q9JNN0_9GAMM|nr:MFS transporter [Entomomonas moraniae]
MNPKEVRATVGLSLVFAFRMLGMFMVLPVMAIYGQSLQDATPILIGLAVGAYGYTQAVLQIPLGMLSDRVGRLPIILIGLLLFFIGSVVAAMSGSIWGVLFGRVLQGMGAISAAVMALLSDLTREQNRTKAMASIGMSIGASFAVAIIMGPILANHFGLHGLFWFIAAMAASGFLLMVFVVPKPDQRLIRRDAAIAKADFLPTLKDLDLFRLDFSIAAVHMVMMANFLALPMILLNDVGLPKNQHWWVYLIAFIGSAFGMIPMIIFGEKKRKLKQVLIASVCILLVCSLFFLFDHSSVWALLIGILVFFIAFNTIEAILPSMISKVAKAGAKGTAMGIFSTSQFLGAGIGASASGILIKFGGVSATFIGSIVICVIWLAILLRMKEPPYVTSIRLALSENQLANPQLIASLLEQQGISDAFIAPDEQAIYIKFDKQYIKAEQVEALVLT